VPKKLVEVFLSSKEAFRNLHKILEDYESYRSFCKTLKALERFKIKVSGRL